MHFVATDVRFASLRSRVWFYRMSISTDADRFAEDRAPREPRAVGIYALLRIKADFLLKSVGLLRDFANGDLQKNLVYLATWLENTRDVPDSLLRSEDALERGDLVLNPATVRVVSDRLNMPYETVRRHANGLVSEGLCVRMPGRGIVIARDRLRKLAEVQSLKDEHALLLGLVSALGGMAAESSDAETLSTAVALGSN
jgi:hypothetical protein